MIVEFGGVVVRGMLARELNMTAKTIAVTAIPTIVGSNGTIAQAPDICLSLSSRVRRSRLRFSSGMLTVVTLLKSGPGSIFLFKTMEPIATRPSLIGHSGSSAPQLAQSLNDRELSGFILCGRGLAWSMISACQ